MFGKPGGDPNALRPLPGVKYEILRGPEDAVGEGELVLLGNVSSTVYLNSHQPDLTPWPTPTHPICPHPSIASPAPMRDLSAHHPFIPPALTSQNQPLNPSPLSLRFVSPHRHPFSFTTLTSVNLHFRYPVALLRY